MFLGEEGWSDSCCGGSLRTQRARVEAGDSQEVPTWTRVVAGEVSSAIPTKLTLWVHEYRRQQYASNA